MTRTVARLLAESLEAHDVDQVYCVPGRELYRADQRADRAQLDPRRRLPPRGRRRLYGGGRRQAARPRRRRDGVARARVCRTRWSSLHSAYHDATPMVMLVGQVERQDFGRLALAGAELFAPPVRRHQAGHRGQRAGTGVGGDRPRLSPGRKRHARAGRGDPARGHLRRGDRGRTRPAAAACRRRAARRGSRPAGRHAGRRPSGRWCWSAAR